MVESRFSFERKELVYDFCKYTYNHRKNQTELQKVYFQNISQEFMVKKVAQWLSYMLDRNYLRAKNQKEILENARNLCGKRGR